MKREHKIYEFLIGRHQPLHAGHIKLIRTVLDEGKNVCIALRKSDGTEKNPYNFHQRYAMFFKEFEQEIMEEKMIVTEIPDIANVVWGRGVGWGTREIRLDSETEKISATKIREGEKND